MVDDNKPLASLNILQQKIDDAKAHSIVLKDETSGAESRRLGGAMHLAGEFVAGSAVGGGIGYGLDVWLGTAPLGFILGFILGFAAGVYTLMRQAKNEENEATEDDTTTKEPM